MSRLDSGGKLLKNIAGVCTIITYRFPRRLFPERRKYERGYDVCQRRVCETRRHGRIIIKSRPSLRVHENSISFRTRLGFACRHRFSERRHRQRRCAGPALLRSRAGLLCRAAILCLGSGTLGVAAPQSCLDSRALPTAIASPVIRISNDARVTTTGRRSYSAAVVDTISAVAPISAAT